MSTSARNRYTIIYLPLVEIVLFALSTALTIAMSVFLHQSAWLTIVMLILFYFPIFRKAKLIKLSDHDVRIHSLDIFSKSATIKTDSIIGINSEEEFSQDIDGVYG